MHAHLGWTLVTITIGTNSTHLDVATSARSASSSPSQDNNAWIPFKLSAVLIVAVCAVSSRSLDVDSLDGAAKGDGETDNNVDATCAWGRGADTVVVFVLEKKSVIKIR